jgi:hypothetical protein
VFKSVDYQDTGADSGKVALSGTGEPGARIFLYFDDTPLGEVSVGSDGTWTFEAERKLASGEHKFRADTIEEGTGIVVGSASIGIMRMEKPAPPKEEVAAAPTPTLARPRNARKASRIVRGSTRCAGATRCGKLLKPITAAAGTIGPSCATTAARSATRIGSTQGRNSTFLPIGNGAGSLPSRRRLLEATRPRYYMVERLGGSASTLPLFAA